MTRSAGYTVIELLLATTIVLAIALAATIAIHDTVQTIPLLEEAMDLQQRTRAAAAALSGDLRAAGAGTDAGPLSVFFPAVIPRGASALPSVAVPTAITIRFVPPDGAIGRLAVPLLPADSAITLQAGGACPTDALACGFVSGSTVVVFDEGGNADLLAVDAIGPLALAVSDVSGSRLTTYTAGARIADLTEVTYAHDAASRLLRREQGGSSLPLVDNVIGVTFSYLGVDRTPILPRPNPGQANCLYAFDGTPLLSGGMVSGNLDEIPYQTLTDGPFCGAGRMAYDVDLLRVRAVRARLRIETAADAFRGTDVRLFARPGSATSSRVLPDVVVDFTTTLRSVGR